MIEKYKLDPQNLKTGFDQMLPNFNSTSDIEPLTGMIGQKRAVKAIDFGLKVDYDGYNIFVSGPSGTGKITYLKNAVNKIAQEKNNPDDWIYVHNFRADGEPLAINLPAGKGRVFVKEMDNLITEVQGEIKKAFSGDEYERQRTEVIKNLKSKQQSILQNIDQQARDEGFLLQKKSTGIFTIPAKDGKPLKQEDFNKMSEEERKKLSQKSQQLQEKISRAMREIRKIEKESKEALKELDKVIGKYAVDDIVKELIEKYNDNQKLSEYLQALNEDIIENIKDFKEKDEQGTPFPFMQPKSDEPKEKYRVNLFIDNNSCQGAPVVTETNPTYNNLTGKVEYTNRMGTMVTNHTMIKPGSLHKANGGFLILQIKDILTHPHAWEATKRALKNKKIVIENVGEYLGIIAMSTLKPQPIPLKVKIILIGNPYLFQLIYRYDEDFAKLFKVKADFDVEMDSNQENLCSLASFISSHCQKEGLLNFSREGVIAVAEYSSRMAGDKKKLSTRFNELVEIIFEANAFANWENKTLVGANEVERAITEKIFRSNQLEEKIQENFKKGIILLDVTGEKIGQINGLSVLSLGDYQFGRPAKITATTFIGKGGIINIEREVKLSGTIHSKGVLILSGYLGSKYAQDQPLSLSASLTFEQSYSGVDGDSASAAELIVLLSSLSEVPIKQNIAITGSVNQRGEIQPVGGISEKVEGFYKVCAAKGITENLGVIIPYQNLDNLLLENEVKNAVAEGRLSIYPIKHVEEGLEIFTDLEIGEKDEDGNYPDGSVNYLVTEKLRAMSQKRKKSVTDNNQEQNNQD